MEHKSIEFTPFQHKVIVLIKDDTSNKDIARKLHKRVDTVSHQITDMCRKTGCRSRVGLVVFAIKHELIKLD